MSKLLLVEGESDKKFLSALVNKEVLIEIPSEGIERAKGDGKDNLIIKLQKILEKTNNDSSFISHLAVVMDADACNPQKPNEIRGFSKTLFTISTLFAEYGYVFSSKILWHMLY